MDRNGRSMDDAEPVMAVALANEGEAEFWRAVSTIAAAYLRLHPAAWPALEEQVRERLRGVGTI